LRGWFVLRPSKNFGENTKMTILGDVILSILVSTPIWFLIVFAINKIEYK
jgi:hypothetical protein